MMNIKNTNKLVKIAQSHYKTLCGIEGDRFIPEEELVRRKEICSKCPKNSINISKDKLSLVGQLRHKIHKPFCIACSCPLDEKLKTPTEECGMVYDNEKPLWPRMLVETIKGTPNMINCTPKTINITNNLSEYIVYVDYIEEDIDFSVMFDTKELDNITNINYRLTTLENEKPLIVVNSIEGDGVFIKIDLSLEYLKIESGMFKRRVLVTYDTYDGKSKSIPVVIMFRKR